MSRIRKDGGMADLFGDISVPEPTKPIEPARAAAKLREPKPTNPVVTTPAYVSPPRPVGEWPIRKVYLEVPQKVRRPAERVWLEPTHFSVERADAIEQAVWPGVDWKAVRAHAETLRAAGTAPDVAATVIAASLGRTVGSVTNHLVRAKLMGWN